MWAGGQCVIVVGCDTRSEGRSPSPGEGSGLDMGVNSLARIASPGIPVRRWEDRRATTSERA